MLEAIYLELTGQPDLPLMQIATRLAGALVCAAIIGFEREYDERPAGLRTHMLVSLASCVYALIMLTLMERSAGMGSQISVDPTRIVQAVTAGVAFLAAGLVVYTKGTVRGLTTGTTMWLCAAVGLACGIGAWSLAGLTTLLALIVITLLRRAEKKAGTYQDDDSHGGSSGD